jgi:hypothetical protein
VVCLKDKKLFQITIGELPHATVFPAFNSFGHGPPLFVVSPRLANAQEPLAVYHRCQLCIMQSPSGWVSGPVFCEFADWLCECEWEDAYRAEGGQGMAARASRVVPDQAPTRGRR